MAEKNNMGSKTIGKAITTENVKPDDEIKEILGATVTSSKDLAALLQEYRNPMYEVFRVFYLKYDNILCAETMTNHLPDLVGLPATDVLAAHINILCEAMEADSVYIVHNHPSGNPEPSYDDRKLTYALSSSLEKFKGHIVIDHTTFALIDATGNYTLDKIDGEFTKDAFLTASVEHPLLNKKVTGCSLVAEIGRKLLEAKDEEVSSIVFTSAAGTVRGIQEVGTSIALDDGFKEYIKEQALAFGAANTFFITKSLKAFDKTADLMNEKYLRDVVLLDKQYDIEGIYWSKLEMGCEADREYIAMGMKGEALPLYQTLHFMGLDINVGGPEQEEEEER